MKDRVCFQCEIPGKTSNLYGYEICDRCQSSLRLHADKTILKNAESYRGKLDSYEEEVVHRLESMEKNFAKTKIKLLHILERLTELT